MKLDQIKKIAIAGAGTMGLGIAQLAAMAGYETILFDINAPALEKAKNSIIKNLDGGIKRGKLSEDQKNACLELIQFSTNESDLIADVIVEAIIEKAQIKIDLFNRVATQNNPDTILATNTSSIPITSIAAALPNPERVVGFHFFNPAHIMKLVEIISGAATSKEVAQTMFDLALKMGKKPVYAKDSPGFIVNRVARHFYVESLKVLEENVASHETIDALIQNNGFRMGPFKLMDLIGVDTNYSVTSSMFESFQFDSKFRPSKIQLQKVQAGHNGRKSGKGFYEYED